MWSGIVMLKHSTFYLHVLNDVILQDLVSMSNARRYTWYMNKNRPTSTTVLPPQPSYPHHDTATTTTVDLFALSLEHINVPLYVLTRVRLWARDRRKPDSFENKTVLSSSARTTGDATLSDVTSHWSSWENSYLPQPITNWSEILNSPGICVAVVVAVVVRFRWWCTRMYRFRDDLTLACD